MINNELAKFEIYLKIVPEMIWPNSPEKCIDIYLTLLLTLHFLFCLQKLIPLCCTFRLKSMAVCDMKSVWQGNNNYDTYIYLCVHKCYLCMSEI